MVRGTVLASILFLVLSCSTGTKPCTGRSDFRWPTPIKGDKHCYHHQEADGSIVAHGEFIQKHPNGKMALQGGFLYGKMHGIWSEYDENGKKLREKYFEKGVEKSFLPAPRSQTSNQ